MGIMRILIIEDELSWRNILERFAARSGYITEVTDNGLDGIQVFRLWKPDLVLLDMGLPDIAGETVLCTLLNDTRTAHIPVVVITGSVCDGGKKKEILSTYGNCVLIENKPLSLANLFARIAALPGPEYRLREA